MDINKLNLPRMYAIRQKLDIPPPLDPHEGAQRAMTAIDDMRDQLQGKNVAVCVGSSALAGS